jgi:hypothetical protein
MEEEEEKQCIICQEGDTTSLAEKAANAIWDWNCKRDALKRYCKTCKHLWIHPNCLQEWTTTSATSHCLQCRQLYVLSPPFFSKHSDWAIFMWRISLMILLVILLINVQTEIQSLFSTLLHKIPLEDHLDVFKTLVWFPTTWICFFFLLNILSIAMLKLMFYLYCRKSIRPKEERREKRLFDLVDATEHQRLMMLTGGLAYIFTTLRLAYFQWDYLTISTIAFGSFLILCLCFQTKNLQNEPEPMGFLPLS